MYFRNVRYVLHCGWPDFHRPEDCTCGWLSRGTAHRQPYAAIGSRRAAHRRSPGGHDAVGTHAHRQFRAVPQPEPLADSRLIRWRQQATSAHRPARDPRAVTKLDAGAGASGSCTWFPHVGHDLSAALIGRRDQGVGCSNSSWPAVETSAPRRACAVTPGWQYQVGQVSRAHLRDVLVAFRDPLRVPELELALVVAL